MVSMNITLFFSFQQDYKSDIEIDYNLREINHFTYISHPFKFYTDSILRNRVNEIRNSILSKTLKELNSKNPKGIQPYRLNKKAFILKNFKLMKNKVVTPVELTLTNVPKECNKDNRGYYPIEMCDVESYKSLGQRLCRTYKLYPAWPLCNYGGKINYYKKLNKKMHYPTALETALGNAFTRKIKEA